MNLLIRITFVIWGLACGLTTVSAQSPNVLFISVDDLNDWTGTLGGHPDADTPNIDALAARGMVFTRAYCNAPACKPSRSSLMSGLRPSTTGIYFNNSSGASQLFTWDYSTTPSVYPVRSLSNFASDNGYTSYGVGKIYHSKNEPTMWDDHFDVANGGINPEQGSNINSSPTNYGPFPNSLADGIGATDSNSDGIPDDDDRDWASASYCINAIENHNQANGPFFIGCGLYRPHLPLRVPQRHWDQFFDGSNNALPTVDLPVVLNSPTNQVDIDDLPPFGKAMALNTAYNDPVGLGIPTTSEHSQILAADEWKESVAAYLASVRYADEQVGRVVQAIDDEELADNTIIVLWSDHGWQLGEKQSWRKFALWEDATRVNMIVVAPGVAPGVCHRTVELLDLYPTLVDLCGMSEGGFLQGRTLRPLLDDPTSSWNQPAITEQGPGIYAVRSERYRYINYGNGEAELYDYETDSSRPAPAGSGFDGLDDWDNRIDAVTAIPDAFYEDVPSELNQWITGFNAPKTTASYNGVFPWASFPTHSFPAAALEDDGTGRVTWSFGFEPGEGFPYGLVGGNMGWLAPAGVHATRKVVGAGYQSILLPGGSSLRREIDGGNNRAFWVKFKAHLAPSVAPSPATASKTMPLLAYRDSAGSLRVWDAIAANWLTGPVVTEGWHDYEIFFDFESKRCNVALDGITVITSVPFTDATVEHFTEFCWEQPATVTGGVASYIDSISVTSHVGLCVTPGFDSWIRSFVGDGGAGSGAPWGDLDGDGLPTVVEYYLDRAPDVANGTSVFHSVDGNPGNLKVTYTRLEEEAVVAGHEISEDLVSWTRDSPRVGESALSNGDGTEEVALELAPQAGEDRLFLRLVFEPKVPLGPPASITDYFAADFEGPISGSSIEEQMQSVTSAGTWKVIQSPSAFSLPASFPGNGTGLRMDSQDGGNLGFSASAELISDAPLAQGLTISFDTSIRRTSGAKDMYLTGLDGAGTILFTLALLEQTTVGSSDYRRTLGYSLSNSPFSLTDGDVSLWPESFVGSSGDIGNIEKTTTDSWDTGEATRITILLTATGFSANIQNPAGLATSWSGPQPEVAYANGGGDGNLFTLQFHTGADMNAAGWWFDNISVVGD